MEKKKIKVYLKFEKTEANNLCAFVTKDGGSWKGVRRNDPRKKKIVLVAREAYRFVTENTLYQATLVPMVNKDGFVATHVKQIQFDAKVSVETVGDEYFIITRFGGKEIVYNPNARRDSYRNPEVVANMIANRTDIRNIIETVNEFWDAVNIQKAYSEGYK